MATGLIANEPNLAVNPLNPNNVVVAAFDTTTFRDRMKISLDGGNTFPLTAAASILAIGPDDRWTAAGGKWHEMPGIDRIIADQRAVCREAGCAYWDWRERMGGSGSMRDWVYSGFAQADHVHLTSIGYRRLSAVLFGDLMQQFESYKRAHERPN